MLQTDFNNGKLNKIRLAEVWLGNFKYHYYDIINHHLVRPISRYRLLVSYPNGYTE